MPRAAIFFAVLPFVVDFSSLALLATEPVADTREAKKDDAKDERVRVLTRRGELIAGSLDVDAITVRTRYGVLRIPLGDVRAIDLALTPPKHPEERIRELVGRYKTSFDSTVRMHLLDEIVEIATQARGVAEELQSAAKGAERAILDSVVEACQDRSALDHPRRDVVVTTRFTVQGDVDLGRLELASDYGTLELARGDVGRLVVGDGPLALRSDKVLIIKTWGDPTREYANALRVVTSRARVRPKEFTGSTAAALRKALRNVGVVVIPELEKGGSTASQVAAEAAKDLQRFCREGGVVISLGGSVNVNFLKASGILSCSRASGTAEAPVVRRHPIVEGVSGTIPRVSATVPLRVDSGKMKVLAGSETAIIVGVAKLGHGAVVYCGWDFFTVHEPHERVLANAVRWARKRQTSELLAGR